MSSIVKGNIAAVSDIHTFDDDNRIVTVTVIDNHQRKVGEEWISTGKTSYEVRFSNAMADRVSASFRIGDAVLIEAEKLRVDAFTTSNGPGAVIKARGTDIGLSPCFKAFTDPAA